MRIQEENKVEQHQEQQRDQQLWGKHRDNDEQLIEELDRVPSV